MTICVAAICNHGKSLVLATDTMVTWGDYEFEHSESKMTELRENCFALTAGSALVHSDLLATVREKLKDSMAPSVAQIAETVKASYQQTRMQQIMDRILMASGFRSVEDLNKSQSPLAGRLQMEIGEFDLGLRVIVGGITCSEGGGWSAHIYEVRNPGVAVCFDSIGFHAIGSGCSHALNALIESGCHRETPFDQALMMVLDAKIKAERAPGVGQTTDLTAVLPKKTKHFSRDLMTPMRAARDELAKNLRDQFIKSEQRWKGVVQGILREMDIGEKDVA